LPEFVHGFGEVQAPPKPPGPTPVEPPCHGKGCIPFAFLDQNEVTQKMETPVIYFYADQPLRTAVTVQFPQGVITETFPAPTFTYPRRDSAPVLANGIARFDVEVLAPRETAPLPSVEAGNIYGHARNVPMANLVRTNQEVEKFIFYRGLGRFQPRLVITSDRDNLRIAGRLDDLPGSAFLVHVDEKGHGQMVRLGRSLDQTIPGALIRRLKDHEDARRSRDILAGAQARGALISALAREGLTADEATAMVATWEHGYLKVPGLRLLYTLPRKEVDMILPLRVSPTPDFLVRAFVGRIEILLESEEDRIFKDAMGMREDFDVAGLGRFAEAMLRRVRERYVDTYPEMREVLDQLIQRARTAGQDASGRVD
ncbi:MAG: hypothetical protein AB7P04_10055, partial [Bacteriovoracia bacterium]